MNDTELLAVLTLADDYHGDAALPSVIWNHDLALREVERRTGMQTKDNVTPAADAARTNRTMWVALAAFAVVIVIGIGTFVAMSGDGAAGPSSGAIDVVGTWNVTAAEVDNISDTNPVWAIYESDGTYSLERTNLDGGQKETFDSGRYELSDGTLSLTTTTTGSGDCAVGDVGTYTITETSSDTWLLTTVSDECADRGADSPHVHTRRP